MQLAGLRIGLIGPLPPPAGGMANQTRQLAELLRADDATVCLVQTNAPYRPAWIGSLRGVRALFRLVAYVHALWHAAGRSDLFHVMANSGWSWHLFAAPAIWVARARHVPVVVNYRGGEAGEFLARSHRLVRWSMKSAVQLIVPSGFLRQTFARFGMPAGEVPNIIDLERFAPGAVADKRTRTHAPQLVVARNLEPLYDNATAIRALAIVRQSHAQATLVIAGTGPDEARLKRLITAMGLQECIRFTGRLERDAMAELYRQSDCCLNPSLADNMPNSVLEALACGVPVVSTNVGGVPYIVEHETSALLVPPGDAEAMAAAVNRLLAQPALAERLRQAGLREVQRYTWSAVRPMLSRVYGEATGARAA